MSIAQRVAVGVAEVRAVFGGFPNCVRHLTLVSLGWCDLPQVGQGRSVLVWAGHRWPRNRRQFKLSGTGTELFTWANGGERVVIPFPVHLLYAGLGLMWSSDVEFRF